MILLISGAAYGSDIIGETVARAVDFYAEALAAVLFNFDLILPIAGPASGFLSV